MGQFKKILGNIEKSKPGFHGFIWIYGICIHLILFIYDYLNPEIFLNHDRAKERLRVGEGFLETLGNPEALSQYLAANGILGDYFFHAILLGSIGQFGIILFQVLLNLIAVSCVYKTIKLLLENQAVAFVGALFYFHLPHTFTIPHFLASEALFNPLVAISFYYLVKACLTNNAPWKDAIIAGLMIGLSATIRPVSLLFPFIVPVIFFLIPKERNKVPAMMLYVVVAMIPAFMWMGFQQAEAGSFGLGKSKHDAPHNLYNRVKLMNESLEGAGHDQIQKEFLDNKTELPLSEYLEFMKQYPMLYLKHLSRDLMVYVSKSGVNKIFVDLFEIGGGKKFQKGNTNWRRAWERDGMMAAFVSIFSGNPFLFILNIFGSFLCLTINLVAFIASLVVIYRYDILSTTKRILLAFLWIFPVYLFFVSQVVNAIQSRMRSPAEFAIVILAVSAIWFFSKTYGNDSKKIAA